MYSIMLCVLCYVLCGMFGLCIGSFLNVLIDRLPQEKSIFGRSRCPYCKKKLQWRELVPLFSFILLGRKCSSCRKKISWQYPIVEIATGILFLFTTYNLQLITYNLKDLSLLCCLLFIASCLIVIFVTDLKYMIVPNEIIYPAIIAAFLYQLLQFTNYNLQLSDFKPLGASLLSGILASSFFLFFILLSKGKWMGMGDVKIACFMGLLLSFPGVLVALLIAFISGSIIGIMLIALKEKNLQSKIPFGPFLSFGAILALFYGEELINWYTGAIFGF